MVQAATMLSVWQPAGDWAGSLRDVSEKYISRAADTTVCRPVRLLCSCSRSLPHNSGDEGATGRIIG